MWWTHRHSELRACMELLSVTYVINTYVIITLGIFLFLVHPWQKVKSQNLGNKAESVIIASHKLNHRRMWDSTWFAKLMNSVTVVNVTSIFSTVTRNNLPDQLVLYIYIFSVQQISIVSGIFPNKTYSGINKINFIQKTFSKDC